MLLTAARSSASTCSLTRRSSKFNRLISHLTMKAPTSDTNLKPDISIGSNVHAHPQHRLRGRAFYESLGSPKFVLAPMVDQSEFAWRMLTRSFMDPGTATSLLSYTPMFHARLFSQSERYFHQSFQPVRKSIDLQVPHQSSEAEIEPSTCQQLYLDGNPSLDRPLFVQFCANDPDFLLAAAQKVAPFCDAVDLNLGCPQGIARKGHYGAFLQEDWPLISRLISTLNEELDVPVTAKIRILETKERTLAYAKMVLQAGASIITVHGRRREQKGHNTGVADWTFIRYLRDNLPPDTVIFANGNILQHEDIAACLQATGADAVMSAEGNLHDPSIFASPPQDLLNREYWRGKQGRGGYRLDAVVRRYLDIIYKYVLEKDPPLRSPLFVPGDDSQPSRTSEAQIELQSMVSSTMESQQHNDEPARKKRRKAHKTQAQNSSQSLLSMQSHLFSLLRSVISVRTDIRDALSASRAGDMPAFERVLGLLEQGTKQAMMDENQTSRDVTNEALDESADIATNLEVRQRCQRPWYVCQPYLRPLPEEALANGSMQLSKKQKRAMALEPESVVLDIVDNTHEQAVAG